MERREYLKRVGAASGVAVVPLSRTAGAEASERDASAGTVQDQDEGEDQPPDVSAFLTNQQLTNRLRLLAEETDAITLREIGRSAGLNDPIWEVTIGEGDTSVHVIAGIDSGEMVGGGPILRILRQLAFGDADRYDRIRENLTLTFVPRAGPDGFMFSTDADGDGEEERVGRDINTQEWESGDSRYRPYYHYSPADAPPGIDLNRDFNVDTDFDPTPGADDREEWWRVSDRASKYEDEEDELVRWQMDMPREGHTLKASGLYLSPECRAVADSFVRADPDYAITLHHQSIPTFPDSDEPSLLSVMAAWGPAYEERAPFYDPETPVADDVNVFLDEQTSNRSLRLNKAVETALAEGTGPWEEFDSVTRYGYTTLWGTYLDGLCPTTDAAGMLLEIAGSPADVGSRAAGLKEEVARTALLGSFDAIAEDSALSGIDEMAYFDIPLKGEGYTQAR